MYEKNHGTYLFEESGTFVLYAGLLSVEQKKEIVSETAEIYLILETFVRDWEKHPGSAKRLLKADMLLDNKKELYRKGL